MSGQLPPVGNFALSYILTFKAQKAAAKMLSAKFQTEKSQKKKKKKKKKNPGYSHKRMHIHRRHIWTQTKTLNFGLRFCDINDILSDISDVTRISI